MAFANWVHGRLDYTVVEDAVNVAERLQSEAGKGEVFVSDETITRAGWPDAQPAGERALKGRREAVAAYRIRRPAVPRAKTAP